MAEKMYRCKKNVAIILNLCKHIPMKRKPQQQTLSVRISEGLRTYLERARETMSSAQGESVSTSDVAKMLLERAKEDRLDDRLELADLLRQPTETLLMIR